MTNIIQLIVLNILNHLFSLFVLFYAMIDIKNKIKQLYKLKNNK